MAYIVKHTRTHIEPYDERKLYASIYAACLSVRTLTGEAELTAERVCQDIKPWLKQKEEVTANDIRHRAAKHLQIYNPHAAYMYLHHRLV